MNNLVCEAGGGGRLLAMGAAAMIAIGGIATAVMLTSCDGSSHAARHSPSSGAVTKHDMPLPNLPAGGALSGSVARAPGEPEMRVRILSSAEAVRVGCASGVLVGQGEPKGTVALPPGAKTDKRGGGGVLTITLRGGQWVVTEAAGSSGGTPACFMYPAGASLVILPGSADQMVTVGTTAYPGCVRLSARTDVREGAFDVVAFVGLEDYLSGVVAKEMLTGWPVAAYQVQAIAARTYALQERERGMKANSSIGYDVESNDRDQVYGGATTNMPAREAVRSTRGNVLMDGDQFLRAYYSSTCGGRTAAARDTWPTGPGFEFNLAGPVQEHHREALCNASPLYRWTQERGRTEMVQRLRWFGERNGAAVRKLKDLHSIEVMSVNGDGRPSRYKIIEPGGAWYQLSAEEMRLACNTNASGAAITSKISPTPAPAPVAGMMPLVQVTSTTIGFGEFAASSQATVPLENAPPPPPAATFADIDRRTRVHSSDFEVAVRGDKVIFTGRGFGHGVGMCQYCAKAFAERGEDWRTMIERFYPGARIVNLY